MKPTRKKRKADWIKFKNFLKKYPNCFYADGLFWSRHDVFGDFGPFEWVDFRFQHTSKKHYFSVALQTSRMEAYSIVESDAYDALWKEYENADQSGIMIVREDYMKDFFSKLSPVKIEPEIQIERYNACCTGVIATIPLNRGMIIDDVVDFINYYRLIGEPIERRTISLGEEIEHNVAEIYEEWTRNIRI